MKPLSKIFAALGVTALSACATDGKLNTAYDVPRVKSGTSAPKADAPSNISIQLPFFNYYSHTTTECLDVDGGGVPIFINAHNQARNDECRRQLAALTVINNPTIKGKMRAEALAILDPQYKEDVLDNLVYNPDLGDSFNLYTLFGGAGFKTPDRPTVAASVFMSVLASHTTSLELRQIAWEMLKRSGIENGPVLQQVENNAAFSSMNNQASPKPRSREAIKTAGSQEVCTPLPGTSYVRCKPAAP